MTSAHVVTVTISDGNTNKTGRVSCATGETATGGGYVVTEGLPIFVTTSAPIGDPPTGWTFTGFLSSGGTGAAPPPWSVTIYVICVPTS